MPKNLADNDTSTLQEGISVIIPTYQGEKWIPKCLESLATQTLDKNLFELIIVINGEQDNTENIIDSFQKKHTDINLVKIVLEKPGVSNARNKGIAKASRQYSTFIDDDDWVSEKYLQSLYEKASSQSIVIARIVDVENEIYNKDNILNTQFTSAKKNHSVSLKEIYQLIGANALKLIPTKDIKTLSYDTSLVSGEDIVFFSTLVIKYQYNIEFASDDAIYYRLLRNNSVSRQTSSLEFNVIGRLKVIDHLNHLFFLCENTEKYQYLKRHIDAQMEFIETYMQENPEENSVILHEIDQYDFLYFPSELNILKSKLHKISLQLYSTRNDLNDARNKYRSATSEITSLKSDLNNIKIQLNNTQTAQNKCHASASYKLGHFLIHEIRSLKDIAKLPNRLIKIWREKKRKPIKNDHLTINQKELREVPEIKNIKVALLCDEFSYNSFKDEFKAITFNPNNWKNVFETNKPDLFFCESAWSGIDSERRQWKGKIYSSINFKLENRKELLNILEYCKNHNIPTVFWNKEDPTHYTDKVHNFIDTAIKFDYIFTTDEDCVQKYKDDHLYENVFCLPFATQPKLFNPIENYTRSDKIIFAGSWYANHIDRSKDMELILDNIIANHKELEIYDRYHGTSDKNHLYPERYHPYLKDSVNHDEIDRVYKSSIFGLNINTVKNSPTMFARRVFELMSSNTFVISNYSEGVYSFFGNNVLFADKDPKRLERISQDEINKIRDTNLHNVLENHTYYNRFKKVLDIIKFDYIDTDNSITIVGIVSSDDEVSRLVERFEEQKIKEKRLLIVLSKQINDLDLANYYQKYTTKQTGVTSLSYLESYSNNWETIIQTTYFALIDIHSKFNDKRIQKALLHFSYLDDQIILLSESNNKYSFQTNAYINNLLAKKHHIEKLLKNYTQSVEGNFYLV